VHYAEKQTLESLAENFFVSKATLIYNFKKYASCSPIDFLLNVRLTKAKELLLNTKKSVNEISEICGFSSANYFGLIFKQKENLSPANYRKYQNSKV
jgi:iron complex transport system substrate-binding protein